MTVRLTRRVFVGAAVAAPALAALPISSAVRWRPGSDRRHHGDRHHRSWRPELQRPCQRRRHAGRDDLGIEWKVIESVDMPSYVPNLTAAAEQGQLVVAVGFSADRCHYRGRRPVPGHAFRAHRRRRRGWRMSSRCSTRSRRLPSSVAWPPACSPRPTRSASSVASASHR